MDSLKHRLVSLLRWSEKYTKTDMVYLTQGGFWLGVWQLFSTVSVFIASIAFANLLPQTEYGVYKYILSIISLISIFSLSGLNTSVTQSVARGFEGSFYQALKTKIRWGLLGSLTCVIAGAYYHLQGNFFISLSFFISAPVFPLLNSLTIYYSLLTGRRQFKTYTIYDSISNILATIATVVTLFLTNNVIILVLVFILSNTLLNTFFFFVTTKKNPPNQAVDPGTISYGKHLSLAEIINLVVNQLDKILVFHYLGAVELAVYSFAVAPTDQIKGLFKNINTLALPKFANQEIKSIQRSIWGKVGKFVVISSVIILIYIILAPLFFKIFFPLYQSSVRLSQILAPSIIFAYLATLFYTILNANAAKKEIYKFQISSNLINIGLLFVLVASYGLIGAVLARLIGRAVTFIISAYLTHKL